MSGYIAPRRHRPGLNIADGRNGVVYSSFSEWGFYGNGQAVRVLPPDDPYAGRVGTVQRTFLEGGELVHVVAFHGEPGDYPPAPNPTAYYLADELKSAEVGAKQVTPKSPQPQQNTRSR